MTRAPTPTQKTHFAFESPAAAVAALLERVVPADTERAPLAAAAGRVLAEPLTADRDSPACDVSAMDGYAVRSAEAKPGAALPIAGEAAAGREPASLPRGAAIRIFTGAPIPEGAEAVIRREDLDETAHRIELPPSLKPAEPGQNIRGRGENARRGDRILEPGTVIDAAATMALASFGIGRPLLYRPLRVAVLVSGDELRPVEARPEPWELHDSNGPALRALLSRAAWVEPVTLEHVADDPEAVTQSLVRAIQHADAVLLTGGVSMGDRDYVPGAVEALGARTVFHKLPIRPGKPVLGAVTADGRPILGLPGNPVSVLCTAISFALAALRKRGGFAEPDAAPPAVALDVDGLRPLELWSYRPVRTTTDGGFELLQTRGSGDVANTAPSAGVVELPPRATGPGPWPLYRWDTP